MAVVAYSVMPDHAHVLVEGLGESSSALDFVVTWKRRTGYDAWEQRRPKLWQGSFYDHILRSDEDALGIAVYIVANPIRAGLATSIGEHAWTGSDVYTTEQLIEAFQEGRARRPWQ